MVFSEEKKCIVVVFAKLTFKMMVLCNLLAFYELRRKVGKRLDLSGEVTSLYLYVHNMREFYKIKIHQIGVHVKY